MLATDFEALKDFILEKNNYFDNGYANAFILPEKGKYVVVENGENYLSLMPTDQQGDYFYLRNEATVNPKVNFGARMQDCGVGRLSFDDNIIVQLVAVVKDADPYKLAQNLRNTAMLYKGMNVIPAQFIWVTEEAVVAEMGGSEMEEKIAALERLRNQTVIRLTLSVTKLFTANGCIVDPCKTC